MSTPFIEIPQRAEALPSITSSPPRPVAPADWLASPSTIDVPDMMFSATPTPQLPRDPHRGELVHPGAVVADVPVDLDLDLGVEADRDRVGAVRVGDPPARAGVRSRSCRRWLSSRTEVVARSTDSTPAAAAHAHATFARSHEYTRPGSGSQSSRLLGARAAPRSRGTRRPSRPSRRSRRAPPACRRSGRAGRRSRRRCRPRRCRSRRGRRGSRAAPARGRRPRDRRQVR